MDALFRPLSVALGASIDQVKVISCLLLSYPLGSVFIRIASDKLWLKHLFNIGVTLVYLIPILNIYHGTLQLVGSILATYFLAKNLKGPSMPWIVFMVVLGHLLINHIIRFVYGIQNESIEVTTPQMVLTMKLTTFAWNVYDGRRKAEDLDKWQTEKRVVHYPSLLEFLGYSFYFPGFLVGPYLDFASYRSLVDESLFKAAQDKGDIKYKRKVPKGRKRVAYVKGATGLAYLVVFILYGDSFTYKVGLTPWFTQKSFLYRVAFFAISGFVERAKYYAIWTLTEGASILTGYGFSGYSASGKAQWHAAANVDVLNIEFSPNFKVLLDSWNMKTNVWLRECVYKRVTPKGSKPGFRSSMTTFGTSAIWHGIEPGYYLTFFLGGFLTTASRLMRTNVRPLLLPGPNAAPPWMKTAYDALGVLCTVFSLNFLAAPFITLNLKDSLTVWENLNWYGLVIIFSPIIFFNVGGQAYFQRLQRKRGVAPAKKVTTVPVDDHSRVSNKNREMKLGLDTTRLANIGDFSKQTPGGSTKTPGGGFIPATPFFVPSVSKTQEELERLMEDATGVVQGFGEGKGYYNQ